MRSFCERVVWCLAVDRSSDARILAEDGSCFIVVHATHETAKSLMTWLPGVHRSNGRLTLYADSQSSSPRAVPDATPLARPDQDFSAAHFHGTARKLLTELVAVARQNDQEYCSATRRPSATTRASRMREAEIANLRFHDLRHIFGTRAANNGASIVGGAEGHGSFPLT